MSKKMKIWLITAASLVLVGCVIFGGVMTVLKWDFKKLSTVRYETNNYDIGEKYKNISIVTNTAGIKIMPSEKGETAVVCYEQATLKHSVAVKDDALVIEINDTRKWYDYIEIGFATPKITIYIPKGEYGNLSVKVSTGDVEISQDFKFDSIDISGSTGDVTNRASALEKIKIKTTTGGITAENISAGSLDLSVSTGKVTVSSIVCEGDISVTVSTGKAKLTDISCKNFVTDGNTGDITLKKVIASEKFSIERGTGDVVFEDSDAAQIKVKTDTGSVTGSLLSDKIFMPQTDTGSISVPKTTSGGRCEITTDTGNIKIEIK